MAEIRARREWIGVEWIEEGDQDEDDEVEEEAEVGGERKPPREVRVLDYACGTGLVTRVSCYP